MVIKQTKENVNKKGFFMYYRTMLCAGRAIAVKSYLSKYKALNAFVS